MLIKLTSILCFGLLIALALATNETPNKTVSIERSNGTFNATRHYFPNIECVIYQNETNAWFECHQVVFPETGEIMMFYVFSAWLVFSLMTFCCCI